MMKTYPAILCLISLVCLIASRADAVEVYQTSAAFVQEAFPGEKPMAKAIWLTGDLKDRVAEVLGHAYRGLRVRYWALGDRTVWILEEIGKVEPITLGVAIQAGQIEEVKVLTYRESRGWEIRFPVFMNQYRGAWVDSNAKLDRKIDGISGATLSVRATTRLARLALALDREVEQTGAATQSKAP
ncbi:MAG: FMN-binding protein [Myxococcales bacterium]|nr:FMN-binding protein [Myxococcales bacterium]